MNSHPPIPLQVPAPLLLQAVVAQQATAQQAVAQQAAVHQVAAQQAAVQQAAVQQAAVQQAAAQQAAVWVAQQLARQQVMAAALPQLLVKPQPVVGPLPLPQGMRQQHAQQQQHITAPGAAALTLQEQAAALVMQQLAGAARGEQQAAGDTPSPRTSGRLRQKKRNPDGTFARSELKSMGEEEDDKKGGASKKRQRGPNKCRSCWRHVSDGGQGTHKKWGSGKFCEGPCAVCGRAMLEHEKPCKKPESSGHESSKLYSPEMSRPESSGH